MKVKDLIETLQFMNPEAEVIRRLDFEYFSVNSVSAFFLREIEYQEEWGVETAWEDCEAFDEGAFPAIYLGI